MAVVMVSFHCRVLNRSVDQLDLAIGPGMVWLGQAVLDPICLVGHIEAHFPRICCVPVGGLLGERDVVIGEDRVDSIGDGLEQMLEELPCGLAVCLVHELRDCKLACPVNANKEIELTLHSLNLGNVDMKEADGVTIELLALRLVTLDIRQAGNAVPLKATLQRQPGQMRNRWLKRIEAITQRQQSVLSECDDHCLLSFGENG